MYGNDSGGVSKESNSKGPRDFNTQQCYLEGSGQTKEWRQNWINAVEPIKCKDS